MCICADHMCEGVCEDQRRALDPLELGFVGIRVYKGLHYDVLQGQQVFLTAEPLREPHGLHFLWPGVPVSSAIAPTIRVSLSTLQASPEVCLLGDRRACQLDNSC